MRKVIVALIAAICAAAPVDGRCEFLSDRVKIGVMNDQSGLYADLQGSGSVAAVRMAVEDFGGKVDGRPIDVLVGDHQNKPDLGTEIARNWFDVQKVGAIVDLPQSAVALSVAQVARIKDRVALISASNLDSLTGADCSPNQVQWSFNNYSLAASTAASLTGPDADTWFLIVVDVATGKDLQAVLTSMIEAKGGKVVGYVRHPLGAGDFASFDMQAQASGAKIIAMVNATADFVTAMKQAAEFGIGRDGKQHLIGITVFEPDILALGLEAAKGTILTMPFYWDLNDATRAFSARFAQRFGGRMPTVFQAGAYSATLHYLKAVAAAGGDADGASVVRKMKEIPVDDPVFGKGQVRKDGLNVHPMYVLQVKSPEESKSKWDVYKILRTIPADQAFRPMADGGCPLLGTM